MMLNLFSEAEAGGGDDAAPTLADERSAEEARGVVWRDADEDLLHELVHQLRRRRPGAMLLAADRSRAPATETMRHQRLQTSAAPRRRVGSSGGMRRRIFCTSLSISSAGGGRGAMLLAADWSRAVCSAEEQLSSDSARWGQGRSHRR